MSKQCLTWPRELEAAADPRRIVLDPDPKSRTGAVRVEYAEEEDEAAEREAAEHAAALEVSLSLRITRARSCAEAAGGPGTGLSVGADPTAASASHRGW